jgi:molybdopterin molybdotransferase
VSKFDRVSVEAAIAWTDSATLRLETEEVALNQASGRVLGADIHSAVPIPPVDCAAVDGFAVRAADSLGAGAYNPLALSSIAVAAGEALPDAMNAVVPLELADWDDAGRVVLVEPVIGGANVDRRGAVADAGALLAAAGTRLAPRHIGLIAAAGLAKVSLVRRPRVRLVIAGSVRSGTAKDSDGPMLLAAIARDGGVILESPLAEALVAAGADIVLVVGGTGPGREDRSAAALAAAGTLDIHGVALVPGETAGFGRTAAGVPVLLLPGGSAACLWSYELFAGRAIRRLGGRDPALPYRSRTMTTARKIVSSIGTTEICPVRRRPDGQIEPVASFAEIGMMAAAQADGFLIVSEASEGYAQGASVTPYFYDAC